MYEMSLHLCDATRRVLPRYEKDFIRDSFGGLWCDVMTLTPSIRLPWHYTPAQASKGDVWECGAVWLHDASLPNGSMYTTAIYQDLCDVLSTLKDNPERAQYTLLVNPDGLEYDRNRLGGDHHATAASGRRFTLSVRRGVSELENVLLAIAW
jgi:hypothetical protein